MTKKIIRDELTPKAGRKGKPRRFLYCKIKCWDGRTRERSTGYSHRETARAEARRMQAAENARAGALDEKTAGDGVLGPTLVDSLEVVLISGGGKGDHASNGYRLVAFFGAWKRILQMVPADVGAYYVHRRSCFVEDAQILREIATLKLAHKLAQKGGFRSRVDNDDLVPSDLSPSTPPTQARLPRRG